MTARAKDLAVSETVAAAEGFGVLVVEVSVPQRYAGSAAPEKMGVAGTTTLTATPRTSESLFLHSQGESHVRGSFLLDMSPNTGPSRVQ
jgi:hypothetical protein